MEPRLSFGSLRVVGQLLASYLVVEGKQGLILVDQHAAHERVLYERLRAEWLANRVSSQPLLLPETEESKTAGDLEMSVDKVDANLVDAAARGAG